jgi:hypothetical protein
MTDRYNGKPFLRLLDNYVLDAIGHLDPEVATALVKLEPKLRQVYGGTGGWREIVAAEMKFPEGMRGAIHELWESGRRKYLAGNGFEPNPSEFTQFFVDKNFPH